MSQQWCLQSNHELACLFMFEEFVYPFHKQLSCHLQIVVGKKQLFKNLNKSTALDSFQIQGVQAAMKTLLFTDTTAKSRSWNGRPRNVTANLRHPLSRQSSR